MKTEEFESIYYSPQDIVDVPKNFMSEENPLYIGGREGQVQRVRKMLDKADKKGFALGVWELEKLGYLTSRGEINTSLMKLHGFVCTTSSDRIPIDAREAFERFQCELTAL